MARYFLSNIRKRDGTAKAGTFWRESQALAGGVYYQHNLHLLAHCLGDRPSGASLAPPRTYDTERAGRSSNVTLTLQPFVRELRIGAMPVLAPLPLGAGLRKFLDDPLQNGRRLNLTLPFCDADMLVRDVWLRDKGADSFHGGTDFSVPKRGRRRLFDVRAAADGDVLSASDGRIALEHILGGVAFRTVYVHLDPSTVRVATGDTVRRGEMLGKIDRWEEKTDISHLHFVLAVKGPAGTVDGQAVPELWYAIDPFGVYDFHSDDTTYLPYENGALASPLANRSRRLHWRIEPLQYSLPCEQKTAYHKIRKIQTRVRGQRGNRPGERNQMLVWLEGVDPYFFLAAGYPTIREIELQMAQVVRGAFEQSKRVSFAYRNRADGPAVSAIWVEQ